MPVSYKRKILLVKQLSWAREIDSPLHVSLWKVWKRFGDFLPDTHFIHLNLNYCIFLLKLRPFKNYSGTFHVIEKHVDIYNLKPDSIITMRVSQLTGLPANRAHEITHLIFVFFSDVPGSRLNESVRLTGQTRLM